jgi:hypothetical protein
MKLKEELQLLRAAAHSYDAVENPNDCLTLIQRGTPYDLTFFAELSDPRWLPLLQTAGVFANVPTTFTRGDVTYYARHAPLFGLTNLAPTAAAEVISILESLEIPENPQVHDQIMRIIRAIDDLSLAPRLVGILRRLFENRSSSEWLWLDEILMKWLQRGARTPCFDALAAFLDTAASDTREHASRQVWQIAELDRKIILPLAETDAAKVAHLLFDVLRKWADTERTRRAESRGEASATNQDDPDFDNPSTYWLEQFGGMSIGSHDFESTLAQRLYKIGRTFYEASQRTTIDEFDQMLRSDSWHLFRRMRWQLYADFPQLTFDFARRDILERIPQLGQVYHGYELALMLEIHTTFYGSAFLSEEEVTMFANAVFAGPTEPDTSVEAMARRARFQRRQLYPIRQLLTGDSLLKFAELAVDKAPLLPDNYKPFSSGGEARTVEHVSPVRSSDLAKMTDPELWTFLNNWVPSRARWDTGKWWVEEDIGALGAQFAELVESQPSRFRAENAWWRNIRRPGILYKPLDRATERLQKMRANKDTPEPSGSEWSNWFGIARWITSRRSAALEKQDAEPSPSSDWNWPGIVVVKFLRAALQFDKSESFRGEIAELLRKLVEDPDPQLTEAEKPWMSDWLTTAINSVRGTAIEGLLDLALAQKKDATTRRAEPWIFEFIADHLRLADESPAIFALLGAHLRLAIHLFQEQLKAEAELLLPHDRPRHRHGLLVAHVLYDGPMLSIVETWPNFASAALECLEQVDEQHDRQRDFGSRLGTHLSFYYWNQAFPNQRMADSILDRFFEVANPQVRANTIGEIARIFAHSQRITEREELYRRTMNLWDRRFSRIEAAIDAGRSSPSEFYEELSEFMRWLDCEAFHLDWRFDRILKAIGRMDKPPRSYTLIETLNRLVSTPETLDKAIVILHAAISKRTDEVMWSYREENLKPLLEKGLAARDPETVRLTEETQEKLLREGFLEYLDVQPS